MPELTEVSSDTQYQLAAALFKEYAVEIGIDLEFQNFSKEVENIKLHYSRPKGVLFLAYKNTGLVSGCFGIREWDGPICELKRMYLKADARGLGIGKLMMKKALEVARELGYQKMRLDTLSRMLPAIGLYKTMGFYEIEPYRFNPIKSAKYFEIELNHYG